MFQKVGKVFFVITTLMVLILGTADWMRGKNAFFLKEIEVEGNYLITRQNILQDVSLDSSKDLFDLQPAEIAEEIKKKHPIVKNVDVVRQLPGAIRINVKEAKPIGVFYDGKQRYAIDLDGVILAGLENELVYDLPIVTGLKLLTTFDGRLSLSEGFDLVYECLRELSQNNLFLFQQVSEVQFVPNKGIILYLIQNSTPVVVGKENISEKMENLHFAYANLSVDLKSKKNQYVDLRMDSQIIVRQL
jgi:cell division septal protein FtsQ